jgi:hypothetical protein
VVAETLERGGVDAADDLLLRQVAADGRWTWRGALRRSGSATEFAQALRVLAKFNRPTAVSTLAELADADAGTKSWLFRFLLRETDDPTGVGALLGTCESLIRYLGRCTFEQLHDWPGTRSILLRELLYEQNPLVQARAFRQFAELGLAPAGADADNLDSVLRRGRWMSLAYMITGPAAAAEIMNTLYLWRPAWAGEFAEQLNPERMLRRLRNLGSLDAASLANLMNVLALAGNRELLDGIVELISEAEGQRLTEILGLGSASRLLTQLHRVAPDRCRSFGEAVADKLASVGARKLVLHENRYWRTLGWAAAALQRAGLADTIPRDAPAIAPDLLYAPEVTWAATWMPDAIPATVRDAAIDAYHRRRHLIDAPNRILMVLIAAARAGHPLARTDEPPAEQVAEAGMQLLAIASAYPDLHDLLHRTGPAMELRIAAEYGLCLDPWLNEVCAFLGRVPPPTASAAA